MLSTGNWWLEFVAVCGVALATVYYFSTSTFGKWQKASVPFVRPVPLFGNILPMALGSEHPVQTFRRIYNQLAGHKYGGFWQMRTPYLMIRDPELINRILIKDFAHFSDRGIYTDVKANPLSNNLFFMGGPKWKVIRNKLSPAFTSGKLKLMQSQIKECGDELMSKLHAELKRSDQLEVRHLMGNYSTDVIGSCAFGLKVNAVSDKNSTFRHYGKSLFVPTARVLLRELSLMIAPSLLRIVRIKDFPTEATDFFKSAFQETIAYREANKVIRHDFVQNLMQARKDLVLNDDLPAEERFTDMEIIANAFVMFAAGFETVSTGMSFCLYELALKKHIQDKVRKEIETKKELHGGDMNNDFLMDLSYMDMVLAESLRKYPPTFALFREATQTYHVPDDQLTIEKGQKLLIPIHSLHYDPQYFKDPETFDPERFTPEEKAKRPSGTYLPFGDGPRICIGKRFAEIEMKLAMSELLSKFEVEPCEKTEIPLTFSKQAFIVVPRNGIWLKFKPLTKNMLRPVFEYFDVKWTISAVVVVAIYVYCTWHYSHWSKLGVKCPWTPLPLFGHFFQSIVGLKHTMEVFQTIYQEMGDKPYAGVYTMRMPQLFIKDPELIGRILIRDFSHFTDRGIYSGTHTNPLNNNIFFTGGERWRIMRKKLSPTFTANRLKYMIEQIKECSDSMLNTIGQTMGVESGKMEIREMMAKYSTDVIGSCAFGLKLDAINDPDSEFRKYGKAVCTPSLKSQLWVAIIFIQPALLRLFRMNNYSQKTIDFFRNAFQETIRHREQNNYQRNDFVQHLMKARKDLVLNPDLKDEDKFSELDIVANAYILFVAGFETVSTSISSCLYELALRKDIQDRVRKEIVHVKSQHGDKMDIESLNKLHYMSMVIKETLRKYPPLIALNREVTKPYTLPGTDITLKTGTKVIIPVNCIHYDAKYYRNPKEFDPERYSADNIRSLHPNTYIPFGDGPRTCIGKRFAEFEIKLALSEVLTNYEVLPCEKTQVPIQYVIGTFVNIPNSVWLKFKPLNV
ncbi:uncharacterized protein LOC126834976 [Adelges cooleyi]|uniref:uncharacterized protein LOC126834976 n=1 Tax=Adelges cooleyi TaxID=133065 RepID=UPI0021809960|nr:uncharacterized protein LOC126834976 [Adelges cooleyi]